MEKKIDNQDTENSEVQEKVNSINQKEGDIPTVNLVDSILSKFTHAGDKFLPAFGGYYSGGRNPHITSTRLISQEEAMERHKDWFSKILGFVKSKIKGRKPVAFYYEPKINAILRFEELASGKEGAIEIPSGVIPIFGKTGTGKSVMGGYLAETLDAIYVRFGEPEIPSIHKIEDMLEILHLFFNSEANTIVIDSFRPFFYLTSDKASTGKGGINNALYMDLTALSSLAMWAGKTVFIVINPMSFSNEDFETVRINVESSTIGLITTQSYGSFEFRARTGNNNRTPVVYRTNYEMQDGKVNSGMSNFNSNDSVTANEISNALSGKIEEGKFATSAWAKIFKNI